MKSIFKQAHELTKRIIKKGDNYRATFKLSLIKIYSDLKKETSDKILKDLINSEKNYKLYFFIGESVSTDEFNTIYEMNDFIHNYEVEVIKWKKEISNVNKLKIRLIKYFKDNGIIEDSINQIINIFKIDYEEYHNLQRNDIIEILSDLPCFKIIKLPQYKINRNCSDRHWIKILS